MHQDARNRHKLFNQKSKSNVFEFVNGLMQLMGQRGQLLSKYCGIGIYKRPSNESDMKKVRNWVRNRAYNLMLLKVINDSTYYGASPIITFDSDQKDGWAENLFVGDQCTFLYGYISRGIHVPIPNYVKPGSHPCLELADVFAFLVARSIHCKIERKQYEWNLSEMGNVCYTYFHEGGIARYITTTELPEQLLQNC
ncbi:hypothetical protein SAMN05428978_103031 [Nitrosomonas sp. Nm34]|nr:hypothetical protein SAMN05428978_103031 [Nitrosomonas sp. Nm34]